MNTPETPPGSPTPQEAPHEETTRRAVSEMKAGLGRPATEMLAEMRQVLAEASKQPRSGHASTQ